MSIPGPLDLYKDFGDTYLDEYLEHTVFRTHRMPPGMKQEAYPGGEGWNRISRDPAISVGVYGELGELAELLKKHLRDGTPLDLDRVAEEAGDLLWYAAAKQYIYPTPFGEVAVRWTEHNGNWKSVLLHLAQFDELEKVVAAFLYVACHLTGKTLTELARENTAKLEARYPLT